MKLKIHESAMPQDEAVLIVTDDADERVFADLIEPDDARLIVAAVNSHADLISIVNRLVIYASLTRNEPKCIHLTAIIADAKKLATEEIVNQQP